MSVKWIKITTDIFDDEKIKIIDTMPARDEIIVIWFKLLTLAGKVNQSGMLFMNSKIAYTPEMLSAVFNRELSTVKLALATFEQFGMIEVEENQIISISNWEKHQNIDGMEKIRLDNARRAKEYRERKKQKQIEYKAESEKRHVTSRDSHALEEEVEEEIEKEVIPYVDIVDYLNKVCGTKYRHTSTKTKDCIKARYNDGFTLDDFKTVINKKYAEWNNSDMAKFLRPETLFSNKFEGYLNQMEVKPKQQVNNKFNNFSQHQNKYSNEELERKLGIRK